MANESLSKVYQWAKVNLGNRILLGYQLHKVNGQVPNRVLLLVREAGCQTANAEIEIDYFAERATPYVVVFSQLPFNQGIPRPTQLRPTFATQEAVIEWLMSAQR